MKGFIEVTTENGTHLLNVKYIEDVWEDEDAYYGTNIHWLDDKGEKNGD